MEALHSSRPKSGLCRSDAVHRLSVFDPCLPPHLAAALHLYRVRLRSHVTSCAALCQHLRSPIAAKVRPYPAGRSGNLVFLTIRGLLRCFRRLRRGASAFLRLAPVQIFPQFHGKALPAFNSLLELAFLGQARHGLLSGLSPHVANLIHCLRVRGFVWQFPPRLRDLFSARLAAVAQW